MQSFCYLPKINNPQFGDHHSSARPSNKGKVAEIPSGAISIRPHLTRELKVQGLNDQVILYPLNTLGFSSPYRQLPVVCCLLQIDPFFFFGKVVLDALWNISHPPPFFFVVAHADTNFRSQQKILSSMYATESHPGTPSRGFQLVIPEFRPSRFWMSTPKGKRFLYSRQRRDFSSQHNSRGLFFLLKSSADRSGTVAANARLIFLEPVMRYS